MRHRVFAYLYAKSLSDDENFLAVKRVLMGHCIMLP